MTIEYDATKDVPCSCGHLQAYHDPTGPCLECDCKGFDPDPNIVNIGTVAPMWLDMSKLTYKKFYPKGKP